MMIIRFAATVLLLSALAGAQPAGETARPSKGIVEGKVTSLAGAPLSKAALRLQAATPQLPSYSGEAGAAGNFIFENVDPGTYSLSAERSGYVRAVYNATASNIQGRFSVAAGQAVRDIVFKLVPQGTITGKVTDPDGDAMDKARVTAYRRVYTGGHWQFQPARGAPTVLDGTFQIGGLAPGRYYLSAEEIQAGVMVSPKEEPSRQGPQQVYVSTYYPAALDPSSAAPVDVAAGAEIRGVDIRIRRERVYRIRGKAIDPLGAPVGNVALGLAPPATDGSVMLATPRIIVVRDEKGAFEFNRLLPGSYVISTQAGMMLNGALMFPDVRLMAWQVVNISDQNVDDLILQLRPPAGLTGTIHTETADPAAASVGLIAADGVVRNNTAVVAANADGTFQISNISPGAYHVSGTALPDGAYVKSMRFGNQDVTRAALDLTSVRGGNLDIVLSLDAAAVAGTVRSQDGEPCPDVPVTLWEPGPLPAGSAEILKTSVTGKNGEFRFVNLAPGDYRIAAWEQVDSGIPDIPEFRRKFESQASSVSLNAKDHPTITVKLVTRGAIEPEAARLR